MKNGWFVNFNETSKHFKDMSGSKLNKSVLHKLIGFDKYVGEMKKEVYYWEENRFQLGYLSEDKYNKLLSNYIKKKKILEKNDLLFSSKFYFELYRNNKVIEKLRIDVGDGLKVNQRYYEHILEKLS